MSPLLALVSLLAKGEGSLHLPRVQQESTLEWEASTDSSAKRDLPAAKSIVTSQVHTHYVPLHRTSPLPFPIFRLEWGFPARFPALWHGPRLIVHHKLDGPGQDRPSPAQSPACPLQPFLCFLYS